MRRKPGGQPNNKNAYKHGFYTKYFSPFESRALDELPITDLTGEIGTLRVSVDRFMQAYSASLDQLDYDNRLAGLRAITLAVGRIASLQRILASAGKNLDSMDELLKALEGVPLDDLDDQCTEDDLAGEK